MIEQLPGTAKIEFSTGALGMDLTQDEISKVQVGSQAEAKGVKAGWKITLINGNEMSNYADIRPTLDRCRKLGKKYTIVFSKPAHEMQAELLAQQAAATKKMTEQAEQAKKDAALKAEQAKEAAAAEAEKEKKKQEGRDRMAANQQQVSTGSGFAKPEEVTPAATRDDAAKSQITSGEHVILKYYTYSEAFEISGGKLKLSVVDEFFGLSAVMPGCGIHLGLKEPVYGENNDYIKEEPVGTCIELKTGSTYFIFCVQDPSQEKKDMERMKGVWTGITQAGPRSTEGCSCLYGSPCTDKYICNDWENRIAVSKANGMLPLAG